MVQMGGEVRKLNFFFFSSSSLSLNKLLLQMKKKDH